VPPPRRRWTPIAVIALVALGFGIPMVLEPAGIQGGDAYRNNDWLSILVFRQWLHHSVHELGQFPLWCPFLGGGYPTVQHPSDGSLTPLAIPVLLFGDVAGVKIDLVLLVFLGGLGVYLTARDHLGLSPRGALFSAVAFQAAGWLPSMLLVGFYNLALYQLIPLIVYFAVRAHGQLRFAIPAGVLFGFFAHVGAMGSAVLGLFLAVLTLACSVRRRRGRAPVTWRPSAALGLTVLIALGVAAVKLVGVADLRERGFYMHGWAADAMPPSAEPWNEPPPDSPVDYRSKDWSDSFYTSGAHFLAASVSHVPLEPATDAQGESLNDEYAFLGIPWTAALLFLPGLVLTWRRSLPFAIAGGTLLVLCFGPYSPLDLYRLVVWSMPPLRDISQFYKYGNFFVLLVITLASGGVFDALGDRRWVSPVSAVALASLLPFLAVHGTLTAERFRYPAPELPAADTFHQVRTAFNPLGDSDPFLYRELTRPLTLTEYHNVGRGVGTVDWYADIYLPENAIPATLISPTDGSQAPNPHYRGEAWLDDGGGEVLQIFIRANSVDVVLDLDRPATLVVNQNHDPRWRSDAGAVEAQAGLLAVALDQPGRQVVQLRFVPRDIHAGIAISATTLLLCGVAWWLPAVLRWRRRTT
jgi:hypothetical protein